MDNRPYRRTPADLELPRRAPPSREQRRTTRIIAVLLINLFWALAAWTLFVENP